MKCFDTLMSKTHGCVNTCYHVYHSQSWAVYDIVLPTFHDIPWYPQILFPNNRMCTYIYIHTHYIGTIITHRWHLGYITPHRISITCAGQAHEQDGQASEMPADFRESLRKNGDWTDNFLFSNQNLGFFHQHLGFLNFGIFEPKALFSKSHALDRIKTGDFVNNRDGCVWWR